MAKFPTEIPNEYYDQLTRKLLNRYENIHHDRSSQELLADYMFKSEGKPKKHTQNWPQYDLAKTNEDRLFKELLRELLFLSIEKDHKPKRGRPSYSVQDKIFCMAIKVYYRSDLRKAQSILKELKRLGYIRNVPCYKSIDNFFNDEKLSKVLDDLILLSSLPLAELEETGAIDATGFSLSRFARWFEHKWGKTEGKERIWRKAHAACGCRTNTILSVEVTEKNVHDNPVLQKVLGNRTSFFDMKYFVADRAYSSKKTLEFIHKLGMVPYIPFKKNITGKQGGSLIWGQMFAHFKANNHLFMQRYHRRSNVETCFSMVKGRFGDGLMTRNFAGNVNEIKMKFLCHNICVLITEAFESNISINFEECVKKKSLCK